MLCNGGSVSPHPRDSPNYILREQQAWPGSVPLFEVSRFSQGLVDVEDVAVRRRQPVQTKAIVLVWACLCVILQFMCPSWHHTHPRSCVNENSVEHQVQ